MRVDNFEARLFFLIESHANTFVRVAITFYCAAMPGPHKEIPVGLNLFITLGQLLGIGLCFLRAAQHQSWPALLLLAALFGILMNSVYAIIHEAEHAMLFPNRFWNDFTGAFLALFFPAPFHL